MAPPNLFSSFVVRLLLTATVLGSLALLCLELLGAPVLGIDDAYIYFVYGRNFLESGGFVYNIGGERVEGFSSPVWLSVVVLAMLFSGEPVWPLLAISSLLSAAILLQCVALLERVPLTRVPPLRRWTLVSWVFAALLISYPSWLIWNMTALLETPLWGLLLISAAVLVARAPAELRRRRLPLVLALVIVCRPEGPLWFAWFVFAAGLLQIRQTGFVGLKQPVFLRLIALPLIALLLLVLLRLMYFGYPLPNTYYAKMSPDILYNLHEGYSYLLAFLYENAFAGFGVLVGLYWLAAGLITRRARSFNALQFVLGGTIATGVLACLITGGDKFGGYRFYQSILPVALIVLVLLLRHFSEALNLRDRLLSMAQKSIVAVLCLAISATLMTAGWRNVKGTDLFEEFAMSFAGIRSAKTMLTLFGQTGAPLPSIGEIGAGGLKYKWPGEVIDLMGLNNVAMGHSGISRQGIKNHAGFDPDVFYAQAPDIVAPRVCVFFLDYHHPWNAPWKETDFEYQVLKGITATQRFKDRYSYAYFREYARPDDHDQTIEDNRKWLCGYVRNDLLQWMVDRDDVRVSLRSPKVTQKSQLQ